MAQWDAAARDLDVLEGNELWKHDNSTGDYSPDVIQQRLLELDKARARGDIGTMMHLIRTSLSRDLGGMGNVDLYRHSYVGTKRLIERYVESTVATIETVVDQGRSDLSLEMRDLLEGMLFARQSFGRSALLLSGGGTFGMSHIGVLKSLFEAKFLPRILSGSSAGSIVCAAVCTRTDEEMPNLVEQFPYGDLAVFESKENQDGVFDHLRRLFTEGNWSDNQHLIRVMRAITCDMTFQEAYNRTRRILNICVSTPGMYELPRLLNYVTAPNVMIWSAVAASCSVPLVFSSAPLLVKDPATGEHLPWNHTPQNFIDGSVDGDLPMTRLAEMFNVNHFIVSQVNPHVVPFLARDDHLSPDALTGRALPPLLYSDDLDWVRTITSLARDEALHRLQFMTELGIFPNLATKCRSVLSQTYSGDITILPDISMHDLPRLLKNPTPEFMLRSSLLGQRATWPKLSRIRDRCAIEIALDVAVHQLRTRVVFSESQRDLRKLGAEHGGVQLRVPRYFSPQPQTSNSTFSNEEHRQRWGRPVDNRQTGSRRMSLEGGTSSCETTRDAGHARLLSRRTSSGPAIQGLDSLRISKSHVHFSQERRHDTPKPMKRPNPDSVTKNPPVRGGVLRMEHQNSSESKQSPTDVSTGSSWMPPSHGTEPVFDVLTSPTDEMEATD